MTHKVHHLDIGEVVITIAPFLKGKYEIPYKSLSNNSTLMKSWTISRFSSSSAPILLTQKESDTPTYVYYDIAKTCSKMIP
jgi:hypothetical protein